MREEYEQLELDTRKQLDKAITRVAEDAIKDAGDMIRRCGEAPADVRNRHEAYGIAAEHLAHINKVVKAIQADTAVLLGTLSDINYPAIEAVSSICNSSLSATAALIKASAEMQRTLRNLYTAENFSHSEPTPMENLAEGAMFAEAEPAADAGTPAGEEPTSQNTEQDKTADTNGKKKRRK